LSFRFCNALQYLLGVEKMEMALKMWKREAIKQWQVRGLTRKQAIQYVEIHGFYHP